MALSENDIRPAELEAGKLEALRTDLARLTRRKGGFVTVGCPACDVRDGTFEFEKYGFSFDRCPDCATVYMNPRATPDILADFYAGSVLYEYWDKHIFPASRGARRERIFRPRVQRILELCEGQGIAPGVLVEIGSASGMFCEEALATGRFRRVVGIEPSAAQAATCREMGMDVIETTVERAGDLGEQADIVASFETIEHVYSPRKFLARCRELLAPGGLLVLTCPNYQGFDIMTLGPLSDSLDAEHINMFNPRSFARLLGAADFEVIELTTPGQLDAELVRKKVLDGSINLEGQPFLRRVLVEDWEAAGPRFQEYLRANLLSSHMWAAARRKA
jgi:SAM-dependent methyltransferase